MGNQLHEYAAVELSNLKIMEIPPDSFVTQNSAAILVNYSKIVCLWRRICGDKPHPEIVSNIVPKTRLVQITFFNQKRICQVIRPPQNSVWTLSATVETGKNKSGVPVK